MISPYMSNLNCTDQANANRILRYIANYLKTPRDIVNHIFDFLENTYVLFHYEPYGSVVKKIKKEWKYLFL